MRTGSPGRGSHRGGSVAGLLTTLLLAFGLAGCTSGLVYDRVDWIVAWYVDGFVTLDDAQDERLSGLVAETMDWHRRTQLPRYVELLDALAAEADRPVDAATVARRYAEVEDLLDVLVVRVTPGAAALLAGLTPAQREELAASFAEDNEELREEYSGSTPQEREARRTRAAIKALQRFYGRLSPAQRALVTARLAPLADVSEQWLERRQHWQERFLGILAAPPAGGLAQALRDLALDPDQFDTPGYREQVEANRRAVFAMLAELSATLSPDQRRHMRRKLEGYSKDLRAIVARG